MTLTAATFNADYTLALPPSSPVPTLLELPGITVLHMSRSTDVAVAGALKSLRGFRTQGRRVVWCNLGELARASDADLHDWGRRIVTAGGADVVVACGAGSREVAMAARDAGLSLGRVVVCRDDATARNVLSDAVNQGDVLLALGIATDSYNQFTDRLESKFFTPASAAHH